LVYINDMSNSNEIIKLYNEIKKNKKEFNNIRKKFLKETDPNKKEKLHNQFVKIKNIVFTKMNKFNALINLSQAFNTPVKSKKIEPKKRKIMEQNKLRGNENIVLLNIPKLIKKKSKKK
jgi:hypothetical protein